MTEDNAHGIAGEAHDLVYGARAATYGHPRLDFSIIAKVWTGLLRDKLKDGEELDAYRVAVMMTGLKLARLVKSPHHKDSRTDTIGYMLTMERLDEPEAEEAVPADNGVTAQSVFNEVPVRVIRQHPNPAIRNFCKKIYADGSAYSEYEYQPSRYSREWRPVTSSEPAGSNPTGVVKDWEDPRGS